MHYVACQLASVSSCESDNKLGLLNDKSVLHHHDVMQNRALVLPVLCEIAALNKLLQEKNNSINSFDLKIKNLKQKWSLIILPPCNDQNIFCIKQHMVIPSSYQLSYKLFVLEEKQLLVLLLHGYFQPFNSM